MVAFCGPCGSTRLAGLSASELWDVFLFVGPRPLHLQPCCRGCPSAWTRPAASQQAVIWAGPLCSGSPLWQRDCLTKRTEPKAGRFHVTSCYLQGIERGRDHSCASAAASRRIMAEVRGFPRSEQTFQNPPVAIGISAGWPLGVLWKVREACARQTLSLSCCPLLGVDRLVSEAARPESADLVPI